MRIALLLALVGCGTNGVGTVVYTDPLGHVQAVDVASGKVTPLEAGTLGEVSISPDGAYAIYVGTDWVPKLDDLHGHVTNLPAAGNCCQSFSWFANDVVTYAIFDQVKGAQQTVLVPARGGKVRVLNASNLAVSSDGTRLAYLDRTDPNGAEVGDFVVEDLDGGNRTKLAGASSMGVIQFTPGDQGLTYAVFDNIERIERLDFSDMQRQRIGAGVPAWPIAGGSRYSPDGSEFLAVDGAQNLVGIAFADNAVRPYAKAATGTSFQAASYVDNGRIVANAQITTFEGDAGFVTSEVVFSNNGAVRTLASNDGSNQCTVLQVSVEHGQLGLQCRIAALTDLAGSLITSRNAPSLLGISGDGNGIVTLDDRGAIELVGANGIVRPLATAAVSDGTLAVPAPYAAYAP